jgi:hypothetical protein
VEQRKGARNNVELKQSDKGSNVFVSPVTLEQRKFVRRKRTIAQGMPYKKNLYMIQ